MLILQFPATLLNSFSNSKSFLVESLVSSIQKIMSSANQDCSPFPTWMPLLVFVVVVVFGGVVFFAYLPWLKCFSTKLTRSGKRGHPYLVPDLRGKALSLPKIDKLIFSMMLALGLYRCSLTV